LPNRVYYKEQQIWAYYATSAFHDKDLDLLLREHLAEQLSKESEEPSSAT